MILGGRPGPDLHRIKICRCIADHQFFERLYGAGDKSAPEGKSHHSGPCILACKRIRIIFRFWKTDQPYSEIPYLDLPKKTPSNPLTDYLRYWFRHRRETQKRALL
jgi:hypothetical protein